MDCLLCQLFLLLALFSAPSTTYYVSSYLKLPEYTSVALRAVTSTSQTNSFQDLQRCLAKEYASFFDPMERRFYASEVEFIDPLTSFRGIDKYKNNVDMLAGRTGIGSFLFEDASIVLHNVKILGENQLQTRWTLQVTAKALPWKPRARFTGISIYTVNTGGKVVKQEDYWDSVNLLNGKYLKMSLQDGIKDFIGQTKREVGAALSAPELPVRISEINSFNLVISSVCLV
jgi:hypothetical protein